MRSLNFLGRFLRGLTWKCSFLSYLLLVHIVMYTRDQSTMIHKRFTFLFINVIRMSLRGIIYPITSIIYQSLSNYLLITLRLLCLLITPTIKGLEGRFSTWIYRIIFIYLCETLYETLSWEPIIKIAMCHHSTIIRIISHLTISFWPFSPHHFFTFNSLQILLLLLVIGLKSCFILQKLLKPHILALLRLLVFLWSKKWWDLISQDTRVSRTHLRSCVHIIRIKLNITLTL